MSTITEPATDAAFWADADRHVLRYSPSFSPVVVERATHVPHLRAGAGGGECLAGQATGTEQQEGTRPHAATDDITVTRRASTTWRRSSTVRSWNNGRMSEWAVRCSVMGRGTCGWSA